MKNWVLYVVAGIAALVVVTGVGGLTAYLVISKMAPTTAESRPASAAEVGGEFAVALKPFTTNLGDTDRPRYISVTFELGAHDEKTVEKLNAQIPAIRDQILQILNSKKSMEVTGDSGANKLKNEVQEKLNAALGGSLIQKVWISDLVVQF
ncbi:MAG TPA: flagellar basal body-associated FliL family protein [Symbiobacteriaceae bacterium]|nr:flagellar basal body-associated FliL family protein [Symbiobacteriaceae bacterium]